MFPISHPPTRPTTHLLSLLLLLLLLLLLPTPAQGNTTPQAQPSLQSYTGLWQMPNARVMPDWSLRLHYGNNNPYRYYGGAVGLWDRLEFHGQFTEVTTIEAFVGEGYGHYKDRSAGVRLVLKKEDAFWPQVAAGFFDATGTALFGSRYLVASKKFGNVDLTLGMGQGVLAGEFVTDTLTAPELGEGNDRGAAFLLSKPLRKTRPFAGIEWQLAPELIFTAEYSTLDLGNMFGYRGSGGERYKADNSLHPVNLGLKYRLSDKIVASLAHMRGCTLAGGLSVQFPLEPEGMLAWEKIRPAEAGERLRWQAYRAKNYRLARILADRVREEGFSQVAVSVAEDALWLEAENTLHLSSARALGHIGSVLEPLLPPRIKTLYLNLKQNGQVVQSLRTTRQSFYAFQQSAMDSTGFLQFAKLDLYGDNHWQEYATHLNRSELYSAKDSNFSYALHPRVRTFLNNKKGFFKHKAVLQAQGNYHLWSGGRIAGEIEIPFYNQFGEVDFAPLEKDAARTDLALYEKQNEPRISVLAWDQHFSLPFSIQSRFSVGAFESAYAGFGAELFRFFHGGRWGIGLQSEAVRKRDLDDNFALNKEQDRWFNTAFVNLYGQVLPATGLEAGLKVGRFLAGDSGVRFELRRSFKYFTLGAWYTVTDTSEFVSAKNRGTDQKGVYIRVPLSLFYKSDIKGHLRYMVTSFTRDPGQVVRQPSSLYPMDPWGTPDHTRRNLDEMR